MLENADGSSVKKPGIAAPHLFLYIYFASGICTLIYGLIWYRLLKLTFGNTIYTSGIIITVLLAGMALGSLIMRRYADIVRKRLHLYSVLELLTALTALLVPVLVKLADSVYRLFFIQSGHSTPALYLLQFTGAVIVLLIPAALTGSTLPLAARCVNGIRQKPDQMAGKIYLSKILGAAAGAFLAGFILIKSAGISGTLYIAVILNVLVAISGWRLSRIINITDDLPEKQGVLSERWKMLILILTILFSALITTGYIPAWIRSIEAISGGSVYLIFSVITVYIAGNATGLYIGSRISERIKHPSVALGICLACFGLFGIFYVYWLDIWHSGIVFAITRATSDFWQNTPNRIMLYPLFTSFIIFIIPAVVSGLLFPFVFQAFRNYIPEKGRLAGSVFSIYLAGAALGVLAATLIMLPMSGIQSSGILLGLPGIWLGCITIFIFLSNGKIILRIFPLILAVCFTIAVFSMPSDLYARYFTKIHEKGSKVVTLKEGINTSVSVHRGGRDELVLKKSGIRIAGDSKDFRITGKFAGHVCPLLNSNNNSILVTGFGSGEAAGCIIKHGAENIDIVEISPELIDISFKYFGRINTGKQVFDNNTGIIYMDPGNYLHLTDKNYDIILADVVNPGKNAEYSSLCTREFFQSALNRLNEDGIFGYRLPLQEIPNSTVISILGTFNEVFPYITIWMPATAPSDYDFLFLAGSREKQIYSPAHIDSELRKEKVSNSVKDINLSSSHYLFSCYICDKEGLNKYLGDYDINSDYSINNDYDPYVEFNTDITEHRIDKKRWLAGFLKIARQENITDKTNLAGMSKEEQLEWQKQNRLYYGISNILLNARIETNLLSILENCYLGLSILPGNIALTEQEKYILGNIYNYINRSTEYADYVLNKSGKTLQQMPEFGNMWLIRSWAFYSRKNINQALAAAENAARYLPGSPLTRLNLESLLMEIKQKDKSSAELKE